MTRLTNQQISDRIHTLSQAGITKAGVRFSTTNQNTGGGTLFFKGPNISRKPAFFKWNFDGGRYQLKTRVRKLEKALHFRDKLVAELASPSKPSFVRAQKLAEALVRQGVHLTAENWAMDFSDNAETAALQRKMAACALKNLETMIEKLPVARTAKQISVQAALQSLQKGLEQSLRPGVPLASASGSTAVNAASGTNAKPELQYPTDQEWVQLQENRKKALHDLIDLGNRPVSEDGSEGSHLSV